MTGIRAGCVGGPHIRGENRDCADCQWAMRGGPREYTQAQWEFIRKSVLERKPLPEPPLPVESDGR